MTKTVRTSTLDPLEFLETMNPNTRKSYRSLLKRYVSHVYGSEVELATAAARYIGESQDHQRNINRFFASVRKIPKLTRRQLRSVIKIFLEENDIVLPPKFWRGLKRRIGKGKQPDTQVCVPTKEELRNILSHMDSKGRSLFLVMSSSGMRIGEALKFKLVDLELEKDPPRVRLRSDYTKNGEQRVAFISSEAKAVLGEWLKVRGRYLVAGAKRSESAAANKESKFHIKSPKDDRTFPFSGRVVYSIWYAALRKSGLYKKDEGTKRVLLHPHTLRKFFRTDLGACINKDVTDELMGHEGYLTGAYRHHSEDELGEFYKTGEHSLLVFSDGAKMAKVSKELEENKETMQKLTNELTAKTLELERELKELRHVIESRKLLERLVKEPEFKQAVLMSVSKGRVVGREFIVD